MKQVTPEVIEELRCLEFDDMDQGNPCDPVPE
jgi:hypothetical protein